MWIDQDFKSQSINDNKLMRSLMDEIDDTLQKQLLKIKGIS